MSNLRIIASEGVKLNPAFIAMALQIAEHGEDAPPICELDAIPAILNINSAEREIEDRDIVSITKFLLDSGTLLGIKWGDKYYFCLLYTSDAADE